jgi:hypothetical protein
VRQVLQERLLIGSGRPCARLCLHGREIQVRPVALHLPVEGEQGGVPIPAAQLFVQQLRAQVLQQLIPVVDA